MTEPTTFCVIHNREWIGPQADDCPWCAIDAAEQRCRELESRLQAVTTPVPNMVDYNRLRQEVGRLKRGYLWLEEMAEETTVELFVEEADGTFTLSIHKVGERVNYQHTDLADLCMRESAEAAKETP